jgi:hypothetical protein
MLIAAPACLLAVTQCDEVLKLQELKRWYCTSYHGQGIALPWQPQHVVSPECEQALVHAFFVVAPILRRNRTRVLPPGLLLEQT